MISVVITTHGDGHDLPGILSSLENQRQYQKGVSTKGTIYLYEAGPRIEPLPIEIVLTWDGPPKHNRAHVELFNKIKPVQVSSAKAEPPCCGHNTREPGIMAANGDWIVMTNSDNFFMHGWLNALEKVLRPGVGIAYWNIVSNLWRWQAVKSQLIWGQIDLSCVCVRADIAKDVGFEWRNYDGDWNYIDACVKLCDTMKLRKVHIDEVLGVHN